MARSDQYALVLLSGGKSARMGSPKPELRYRGKTFLEHMLAKGKALGIEKCYISGYSAPTEQVEAVADRYPDRGPLGGIQACMQVMTAPYCLVLPVDTPTLPVSVLDALLSAHERSTEPQRVLIWEHGDRQEPLIAVYPAAMASHIEELIRERSAPVFRAIDRWGFDCFRMELDREMPININTPELYADLLAGKTDIRMD